MPTKDSKDRSSSRRDFIKQSTQIAASLALVSSPSLAAYLHFKSEAPSRGEIRGSGFKVGHLLKDVKLLPPPSEEIHLDAVIVGGGISGLSAAWKLQKNGIKDFMLLELEDSAGGNSRSGKNAVSAYPWGAHYVPLPALDSTTMIELFHELGIIKGFTQSGLPIYEETYLSNDPQERLFVDGRWNEGLLPVSRLKSEDHRQLKEFFSYMDKLRNSRGRDGRRLFSIPIDESSTDSEIRGLDQITMNQFMDQKGWSSPALRWHVNYCCRDDYGSGSNHVSAWAGVHYFVSREGIGANAERGTVITWPEGNGWLARRLIEKSEKQIHSNALVFKAGQFSDGQVYVDFYDTKTLKSKRVISRGGIFAAPRFVAARVMETLRDPGGEHLKAFEYSPWMVANLTLKSMLNWNPSRSGAALSWDNVLYESPSLGYVNAGNQKIERYPEKTVLTYYLPLDHTTPKEARSEALQKNHKTWVGEILADLSQAHPDIRSKVETIDVWLWGHGMIRPLPGFIWGQARQEALKPEAGFFFAHTDMSGISIFEEALYRGFTAADQLSQHFKGGKIKEAKTHGV